MPIICHGQNSREHEVNQETGPEADDVRKSDSKHIF